MEQIRARQGDTVDLICYRHYGHTTRVVEAVYEANPGLADIGPVLPHGQQVHMPAVEEAQPKTETITLWT